MRAINLTMQAVELDPVNGPGMLAPASDDSGGRHARDLEEVTDRERALADAGIIELQDSAGRRRNPDPPAAPAREDGES